MNRRLAEQRARCERQLTRSNELLARSDRALRKSSSLLCSSEQLVRATTVEVTAMPATAGRR